MPIHEFECKKDGKFDSYVASAKIIPEYRPCPKCGKASSLVEISRPARRNPEHGIQR